ADRTLETLIDCLRRTAWSDVSEDSQNVRGSVDIGNAAASESQFKPPLSSPADDQLMKLLVDTCALTRSCRRRQCYANRCFISARRRRHRIEQVAVVSGTELAYTRRALCHLPKFRFRHQASLTGRRRTLRRQGGCAATGEQVDHSRFDSAVVRQTSMAFSNVVCLALRNA